MEARCTSETSVDFNELHGIISKNIKFFISTYVRTSNLTYVKYFVSFFLSTERKINPAVVTASINNPQISITN
jgi:hypothetical protein